MATVEIFSQGEELVTGQTLDTNAGWLSERLVQMGFTVSRHTTVGDKLEDLVVLLKEVALRADCCICTGGLGPTIDDLTAEAVAIAFDRPLQFDATAYHQISQYFSNRNRPMPESNRKQAMLPLGAERLDNDWGTAPGFALQQGLCWFAFVPGVPYEMRHLYHERIQTRLLNQFNVEPSQLIIIKSIGIGESDIQERLKTLVLPKQVQLSFRTSSEDNHTKLLFPPAFPRPELEQISKTVAQRIGEKVFTIAGVDEYSGDLPNLLASMLENSQQTMAVAETLTQGLIASKCITNDNFLESWFCRDIEKLGTKLGFEQLSVLNSDEQRRQLALKFAERLSNISGADLGLVQLCFQANTELRDKKSTATLHTAVVSANRSAYQQLTIGGPIGRKQNQAALHALDFVRRFLKDNYCHAVS